MLEPNGEGWGQASTGFPEVQGEDKHSVETWSWEEAGVGPFIHSSSVYSANCTLPGHLYLLAMLSP